MSNLVKKVQFFSKTFNLLSVGDKVVVGVSGGPDSTCLLDILIKMKRKYQLEIIIAHVNYNLRGKDSKEDKIFVEKLAKKYNLKVKVLEIKRKLKKVNEEKLRDIRYNFFKKIKKKEKFTVIAVAHNRDDQAETFLMRVLRGSGLNGLRCMRKKNQDIIRPLLRTSREEILKYLKENKLEFRVDQSNDEMVYLRNKIRHKLIPLLEREYNPKIKKVISLITENVSDDYDFINLKTVEIQKKIISKKTRECVIIIVSEIKKNEISLQRQILRNLILQIKGDLLNTQALHIEEILKIINSNKNKRQVKIISGLKIERKGDKLQISV